MLKYDGWADRGWTGVVDEVRGGGVVFVMWDNKNEGTLAHSSKNLIHEADMGNDPNIVFLMHKREKL